MTNYRIIDLEENGPLQPEERAVVEAVINEGRLRAKEEILAKIERKITEAYAEGDRKLADFLYELIRDLDLDM